MKLWPTVKNAIQAKVPGKKSRFPKHHPYWQWHVHLDASQQTDLLWLSGFGDTALWFMNFWPVSAKCVEEHRLHLNFYFRNSNKFVVLRVKKGKGYSWQLLTEDFGFESTAFTTKSYISNHTACLHLSLHSPKLKDTTFQKFLWYSVDWYVKNLGTLDPNTFENYGKTALTSFEAGFLCNILNCVTAVEQRDLQKQMFLPVSTQQLEHSPSENSCFVL